jgi:hypothetical protein
MYQQQCDAAKGSCRKVLMHLCVINRQSVKLLFDLSSHLSSPALVYHHCDGHWHVLRQATKAAGSSLGLLQPAC